MLTTALLRKRLEYEPSTGVFKWRMSPGPKFPYAGHNWPEEKAPPKGETR